MTLNDLGLTSLLMFSVLILSSLVGWSFGSMPIFIVALIGAFVLGIVNVVKRNPSPPLMLVYSVLEGYVLGFFSMMMESRVPGGVLYAVLGTFVILGVMLALFRAGIITGSTRLAKFLAIAMGAYVIFLVINLALSFAGVGSILTGVEVFGLPLGVITSFVAMILGALSLSVDFRMISDGINREPQRMAWYHSFGLMLSLIWIYTELLRLQAFLGLSSD